MENGDDSRRKWPIRPPSISIPISCHRRKRWRRHGNGRYSSLGLHVWTSISFRITHVLAAAHPSWAFQTAANRWNPLILTTLYRPIRIVRYISEGVISQLGYAILSFLWTREEESERRRNEEDGRRLVIDPKAYTLGIKSRLRAIDVGY